MTSKSSKNSGHIDNNFIIDAMAEYFFNYKNDSILYSKDLYNINNILLRLLAY